MSLKVWLQFNGNLENKGLEEVKATIISDTQLIEEGKVGGALLTSTDGQGVTLNNFMPKFSSYSKYSITTWVYIVSEPTGHSATILSSGNWNQGASQCCFGLYNYSNNEYKSLLVPNLSSFTVCVDLDNPIKLNRWYHIAIRYDGVKTEAFINGKRSGGVNYGGITSKSESKNLNIGRPTYTSYFPWKGKISDLRIYDDCLSDKQIYDISKGLMLNYSLNENINRFENVFKNPTFINSGIDWGLWGPSGHKGNGGLNKYKQFIYRNGQDYSFFIENGDTATASYLFYQSPEYAGGYRSLTAIIKEDRGIKITNNVCYPSWNADNSTDITPNKWTNISDLGDGFYLCKCEGFSQTGSNDLVGIYVKPGYKIYVSECYLENSRFSSFRLYNNSSKPLYISDNSGFNNNGAIEGEMKSVYGSGRYNLSCHWDNTSTSQGYIVTPMLYFDKKNITINLWVKLNASAGGSGYHIPIASQSGSNFELSIDSNGKLRGGMVINGTRHVSDCSNPSMYDKKWHMITISYDGNVIKRYVDGKEYEKTSITGNCITNTKFYLGQYGTNSSYFNKDVSESDVRIYSTALSNESIKQLYETGCIMDNFNNILSYDIYESDENLLTHENSVYFSRPENNSKSCGSWGFYNNENAMIYRATDYYFGSDDPKNSKMLYGFFKPKTSYIFDLWLDTDDLVSNGKNVPGGFIVIYNDGSTEQLIVTGNKSSKKGYQHIHFISDKNKSITSLSVYYYVGYDFYVRWDSYITEYNKQNIKKNGIIEASKFIENTNTNENIKFYKGGIIKCSELDKI